MFEDFNWIEAMRQSPVMVIILVCSLITLAVAVERLMYFSKRRGNPESLLKDINAKLRTGDLKDAQALCGKSAHPVGAVSGTILANWHLRAEALEEKLQIALSEQRLLLERNLGVLGTMGNTAPLIGLLGTVWGIMRAFHDMARSGTAGPSVVAAGVAEALFTTATSLLVAVPAVLLYNHFTRKITVMLTVAENHARGLRIAIDQARSAPAPQAPRSAAPAGEPVHAR
jgi:biopolymer transport protein ExbB